MPRTMTPADERKTARPVFPPKAPTSSLILGGAGDFQRDTLGMLERLAALGDVVRFRFVIWPSYFVNHPDYIKHVLQENYHNYNKDGPSTTALKSVVGVSLFTDDGDSWLRRRRLAQPAFHRQRIAALGALMTSEAEAMLSRWDARPADAGPVDVAGEMMGLTLRIVGLALFGADMSDEVNTVGASFTTILDFLTRASFRPYLLMRGYPARGKRAFHAARAELDRLVYDIIARRRREGGERDDLLSLLLNARDADSGESMNDQQLRNEVISLLLAGHETTAVALTWIWSLLSRQPEAEARLHGEVAALGGRGADVSDLPRLPYTRMVIEEVMRLYPPAWAILRNAVGPDQIGPYTVPAGTAVLISPYSIQRHPDYWERPNEFDPERFAPEREASRPRFAYLPFGGGPRQCIGNTFALTEAHIILATVAQRYRLCLDPDREAQASPLITLRPESGLRMRLERRV
ncbi:MAG TPA: cytochrome P450 [Ktedonobacterales bacterium]